MNRSPLIALGLVATIFLGACSGKKTKADPELSALFGKKVALVDIQGETTARTIVEVALVNQLMRTGDFILIAKNEVAAARKHVDQDPMDLNGIAKRAGADVALRAVVDQFDAVEREGYSAFEEEDSQLAEERGDDGKSLKYYKVRSLEGTVRVTLEFTNLSASPITDADTRSGLAEYSDKVVADNRKSAPHLPPRLRYLETIANEAFKRFFDKYR